jgi:uncharacterized membrane protein YccC
LGRTNPTHRDTLRALEENWQQYRRALRRVDKPHFDRLFEHAREHADAAGYLNHQEPEITLLVSVVLEQEKRMQELHARIRTLERKANITADNEREPPVTTGGE